MAAGGGKWAAPWMVGVNLQARMMHAPYVRTFEGAVAPALADDRSTRSIGRTRWLPHYQP